MAKNADIILYLQVLKDRGLSFSTLLQQVSAISRFYLLADLPDPTRHKLVSAIVSAAKRLSREVRRAVPATIAHIKLLAARAMESKGFAEKRTFVMSLVLLCSCCRLDDIICLRRKEVWFMKGGVRMVIPKSKTDQYWKGHVKYMAASKNPNLCPILVLTAWLQRKEVGRGENDAVFPHGHKTSRPTSKSTYSATLDRLQKNSGLPHLTPHSFRSGHVCISIGNGSDPSQPWRPGIGPKPPVSRGTWSWMRRER